MRCCSGIPAPGLPCPLLLRCVPCRVPGHLLRRCRLPCSGPCECRDVRGPERRQI
ncbi:unnamed protein product [Staurois parvus]|uniref:CCHC-type domain-containing protein n=1 Tax=Staurois parvus TaxID=386267 RepID=A0ABN9DS10_9NEOB|nr:unnamed protein product [Staurois parvus]